MFNKKSEKTQKHYNKNIFVTNIGTCINDLPKLRSFIFLELPAQKDYPFGLTEAEICSKTTNGYHTRLYLPNITLVLEFEFDCAEIDFPKLTQETIKTEEFIDKKVVTKKFLHGKKETHQYMKIETIEYTLSLGGLSLVDYLVKNFEVNTDTISEFLIAYGSAEKVFRRELPLDKGDESLLKFS